MTPNNRKNKKNQKGTCNPDEHKNWNRRSFIQAMGLIGGGTMAFANSALSVSKPSHLSMALDQAETDNVLILLRLAGGNDGLNTVVPLYDYSTYKNARPNIGLNRNELFNLSDDFGMPKYAGALERLWGDGKMKVVHGVGYENSTLSHFNGSDIWATTGSPLESTGWLGRYFEDQYPDYLLNPPSKPTAVQIGGIGNVIFDGVDTNYAFTVGNLDRLAQIAESGELYELNNLPDCRYGDQVGFMKGVANSTFSYAGVIHEAYEKSTDYAEYPENDLAHQLRVIARLIKGGLGAKIYMVSLGGFDTHNNQPERQEALITMVADTVGHFYDDLKASNWDDKVLTMTISEFGRRLSENGSNGTDHGRASAMMLFGGALNGNGFVGEHPDLKNTDGAGNLTYTTDFRQVYTTVLKDWLCADPNLVDTALLGNSYDPLNLGFSCQTLSVNDNSNEIRNSLVHTVTYSDQQTYLHLDNKLAGHAEISLYSVAGQKIGVLKNSMLMEGRYAINVKEALNRNIPAGVYIYRIATNRNTYSSKFVIN